MNRSQLLFSIRLVTLIVFVLCSFLLPYQHTQAAPIGERLRVLASQRNLLIGATLGWKAAWDSNQTNIHGAEFNIVTSENNMKWRCIHVGPDEYNWRQNNDACTPVEDDIAKAEELQMKYHGHTLIWHDWLPDWVLTTPPTQLQAVMVSHINTVMRHFAGHVYLWDVVNEALNDCDPLPCGYRESIWKTAMGIATNGVPSYIPKAFQTARSADPNAILIYNDYNIGDSGPKSDFLYAEVKKWLTMGVPIDGIGFQMHVGSRFEEFEEFSSDMQRFADLGLDIYITELDVSINEQNPENYYIRQAAVYNELVQRCLAQPRCKSIQTWGLSDNNSWLSAKKPLLFDGNLEPKPAYYAVQYALQQPVLPIVSMQAEEYNTQSGVTPYATFIGSVDNGDSIKFDTIDFGSGYVWLRTRYAKGSTTNDTWVEVRLDSATGLKLAELHTAYTGGWNTFVERSALLSGVTGRRTVYFVFRGDAGVGNFDWFRFERGMQQKLEVERNNANNGLAVGDTIVYNVQDGAWLRFDRIDLRSGFAALRARYAKGPGSGNTAIELRQDSLTGPLLATMTTQNTADWDTHAEFTAQVNAGAGVQTLFVVFRGSGINVDWFRLESEDAVVYVAPAGTGVIGNISYDAQDILAYYLSSKSWKKFFDGSDVLPAGSKIDGVEVQRDGRILLSLDLPTTIAGLVYDDSDVLRFTPGQLGETTTGSFTMYFDGSDVALLYDSEDVDAIGINNSNILHLSTIGVITVPNFTGEDADVSRFNHSALGNNTTGAWEIAIDGSDINLTGISEDVDGMWLAPHVPEYYLGTLGSFAVTDNVVGDGNDIFVCYPITTGATTSCRNRFFRDMGGAGLLTVGLADFSISTTPRPVNGTSALQSEAVAGASAEVENIAAAEELMPDDPAAEVTIDNTPQNQTYPEDITVDDMPRPDEEPQEEEVVLEKRIFLPLVTRN